MLSEIIYYSVQDMPQGGECVIKGQRSGADSECHHSESYLKKRPLTQAFKNGQNLRRKGADISRV